MQCKWQGPEETGYSVQFVHETSEVLQGVNEANEDCTPCRNELTKMQEKMGNFFSARSVRYRKHEDEEEEEEEYEEEGQAVRKCFCKLSWQQHSFFSFIHKKPEVCTGEGCWLKYQAILNFDQPQNLVIDGAHQNNIDVSCPSCLSGECTQIVSLKSFHIIKIKANSTVEQEVDVRAKSKLECLQIELRTLGIQFFAPKQLAKDVKVVSTLDQTLSHNVAESLILDEEDTLKKLTSNPISPHAIGDLINEVKRDTKTKKSDHDKTVKAIKDAVNEFEKKEVQDISNVSQEEKVDKRCEEKQFPSTCIVHPGIYAGKQWQQKLHGQACRGNLLLLPLQRPRPLQNLGIMATFYPLGISSSALPHLLTARTDDLVSQIKNLPTSLGESLPRSTILGLRKFNNLNKLSFDHQMKKTLANINKPSFNSYLLDKIQQYEEKRKYIAIRLQDTHSAQDVNRKMPSGLRIHTSRKGVDPEYVLKHDSMSAMSLQLESLDENGKRKIQQFHGTSRLTVRLANDRTKVHIEQWQPPSLYQRASDFVSRLSTLFTWTSTSESRQPLISEELSVLTQDDVVKCFDSSTQDDNMVDQADQVPTSDNDDRSDFDWDPWEDEKSTADDTSHQESSDHQESIDHQEAMDSVDYSAVTAEVEDTRYETPEPLEGFSSHPFDYF